MTDVNTQPISRELLRGALEVLDIDPDMTTTVLITPHEVRVDVFALDAEGNKFTQGGRPALVTVTRPVL